MKDFASITSREKFTLQKTQDLKELINSEIKRLSGKACVYATGSFGRLEANTNSDLDLFIVALNNNKDQNKSALSHLDEILLKSSLIQATRQLNIPDFDGDGKFLQHYRLNELIKNAGNTVDDYTNTMSARLLMFLESKPLIEDDVYNEIIEKVVDTYWIDYNDNNKNDFIPSYLTNDILRLWRTFCVNYEANKRKAATENSEDKIKNKIKNYKLKHSRMLTCFSSIIYLLAIYHIEKTVSRKNAIEMTQKTPLERISWIKSKSELSATHDTASGLIELYNSFLEKTEGKKEEIEHAFQENNQVWMQESYQFGDKMYELLNKIGNLKEKNRLYRLITV